MLRLKNLKCICHVYFTGVFLDCDTEARSNHLTLFFSFFLSLSLLYWFSLSVFLSLSHSLCNTHGFSPSRPRGNLGGLRPPCCSEGIVTPHCPVSTRSNVRACTAPETDPGYPSLPPPHPCTSLTLLKGRCYTAKLVSMVIMLLSAD